MKLRVGVLFLAASLSACGISMGENVTSSRKMHQHLAQSFALNPNADVTIKNIAGSIDVSAWSMPQIDVSIDKYGETQRDLDNTSVAIDHSADTFSAGVQYRENERGGSVEYHVRVPAGVKLRVENISGPITVAGVSGALVLKDVSGSIRATGLASDASVDSVSGGVRLSFTKLGQGQSVNVKAVSARITIDAPPTASAAVTAKTISGPIRSQFPGVHAERGNVGMSADGSIGKGEATLKIEAVSGSIDIDKAQ